MTRYACSDAMCGADDCKTCHPLNIEDEEDLQSDEDSE